MITNVRSAFGAVALGIALASLSGSAPALDASMLDASVLGLPGGRPDTLVADPAASTIRWKGTKFRGLGKHEGTIALASGQFVVRHEQLTSGTFTIDMRSIEVTDIPVSDPVPRRRLRNHLMDADFFDVERHPTAVFKSTGAKRIGPARWQVSGDLTVRGVTRPISFATDVRWLEVGHMVATSALTLDRQRWGVAYRGSRLTNDLVDDDIHLSITLDARRKQATVAER
jgi:polyisoprenoid-binding protein YceI